MVTAKYLNLKIGEVTKLDLIDYTISKLSKVMPLNTIVNTGNQNSKCKTLDASEII
jgi:hypothetical protein